MSTQANTAADRAIQILGGPVEVARLLQIDRYQTVQSWRSAGVPARYCVRIESLTRGAITRRDMRPADWMDYWPELAANSEQKPATSLDGQAVGAISDGA